MAKDIRVKVLGDVTPLRRALNGASKNVKEFEGHMGKASRGALSASGAFSHLGRSIAFASGAFLGAAGFTAVVRQSISAASDLHEQINKSDVVFGKASRAVKEFAKTSATSFGIAEHEALGMASTFGNLLHPMGIARTQASKMSVAMVKLAADMASFNNADPTEVLRAIQSGISGQARPLRQFGVFLSEARVKAEAFSSGLAKADVDMRKVGLAQDAIAISTAKLTAARAKYGEGTTQVKTAEDAVTRAHIALDTAMKGSNTTLTDAQKGMARYQLIMKDSKDAQGDFARTSGGLANQQRILKAELQNTEAMIGTALMPTVLHITKAMTEWLGKSENQKKIQHDLNTVISTAGDVLKALKAVVDALIPPVKFLNSALGGTKHTFELLFALGIVAKLRAIAFSLQLVGDSAATAGGKAGVAGLTSRLGALRALGPITISIVLAYELIKKGGNFIENLPGANFVDKYLGGNWLNKQLGLGGSGKSKPPIATRAGQGNLGGRGGHPAAGTGQTVNPNRFNPHGGDFMGTPGYEGSDIMTTDQGKRTGGASVLAPDDGSIIRVSTSMNAAGNVGPRQIAIYYETASGTWWMGHLKWAAGPGRYSKGDHIATIAEGPSAHLCVNFKPGGTYNPSSRGGGGGGTRTGGGGGGLKVGASPAASTWKGATQATIIAAKASVTSMLAAANTVIGGMAGPMDAIERAAEDHLRKLREHLHPHMTPADLARTKADIAKWGKVLTDEIAAQTKAAKRSFDAAAKTMLRAFDKETAAGLKARAAPDETPTEALLRQRQESRDDASRQAALDAAIAAGDAQAIADAQYDIETAALEKQAAAERKAADEKAAKDQEDYQNQRDDQRQALQDQLDDWNEWLSKKAKSWNQFWAWVKANPNGGGVVPNIGEIATAPGPGSSTPKGGGAGYTQVTGSNKGGFVQVSGSSGLGGNVVQHFARGGVVAGRLGSPTLAVVHGGETVTPPGSNGYTIIENVINLDGETIYRNQKRYAARDMNRNGGTGIRA